MSMHQGIHQRGAAGTSALPHGCFSAPGKLSVATETLRASPARVGLEKSGGGDSRQAHKAGPPAVERRRTAKNGSAQSGGLRPPRWEGIRRAHGKDRWMMGVQWVYIR